MLQYFVQDLFDILIFDIHIDLLRQVLIGSIEKNVFTILLDVMEYIFDSDVAQFE